jgi:hypothetical protein
MRLSEKYLMVAGIETQEKENRLLSGEERDTVSENTTKDQPSSQLAEALVAIDKGTTQSAAGQQAGLTAGNNEVDKTQADWDLDTLVEQIWKDLNGAVARSAIQDVLVEVVTRYEKARIQTFVPIFIRRDAVQRLRILQSRDASFNS